MRFFAQVVFFIGLFWLVATAVIARPLAHGAVTAIASDYSGKSTLSAEETNRLFSDLKKKIPAALPNPIFPILLLLIGGIPWALTVQGELDRRRKQA